MVHIVRCDNSIVTDYYLNVIGKMLSDCGETIQDYDLNNKICKNDIVVVATVLDFFKMYEKGFRKIIFWMQGIEAEESFLKHQSKLRKFVLDKLTKLALTKASAIFYVSEAMRKYEENKFKINTKHKCFIMPCFNVSQNEDLDLSDEKYKSNIFTYVGSLSKWQCFEETIDFYKMIEELNPKTELRIYTFQKMEAEKVLVEKKVKNYSIDTVPPEKVTEVLESAKFGFVLRDDIAINNVATPTKLSSYLSAGVIPVFSSCLTDFYEKTRDLKYVVSVEDKKVVPNKLKVMMSEKVYANEVEKEYKQLFLTYYNPKYYEKRFNKQLISLLK